MLASGVQQRDSVLQIGFFLSRFFSIIGYCEILKIAPWAMLCCAKSLQSCPTLCDPLDRSPPGSSVWGILQARTLERVAGPSSRGSSRPRDGTGVSCVGRRVFSLGSPTVPCALEETLIASSTLLFNWSIVALQRCLCFRCTASRSILDILSPEHTPAHPGPVVSASPHRFPLW